MYFELDNWTFTKRKGINVHFVAFFSGRVRRRQRRIPAGRGEYCEELWALLAKRQAYSDRHIWQNIDRQVSYHITEYAVITSCGRHHRCDRSFLFAKASIWLCLLRYNRCVIHTTRGAARKEKAGPMSFLLSVLSRKRLLFSLWISPPLVIYI